MPLTNIGVAPGGALGTELTAVNRRAFVPRLVVQMYFASPSLFYLMGNSQRAAGGMNQITIPLQGQSMVQGQFTNYAGGFPSPPVIPGVQNGQWNLAYWVVPIPVPFGERVIQATDRVISLLSARMNDAAAVTKQQVARLLFTVNNSNPSYPDSLASAFDNGTNVPTYGGINRTSAGNSNFQGQYINLGAAPWTLTAGFTQQAMAAFLIKITDAAGGEAPTFVVMNPADYATLNTNIMKIEQVNISPGRNYSMDTPVRSGFPNITIAGVPIFADHFCPVGNVFATNVKYTNMYIDEDANYDFSGFQSLIPINQNAQQGIIVLGYDVVSAKSVSGAWGYGLGGPSF